MFVLGTLHIVCLTRATQLEYVDDRNYPGGPLGFAANADLNPIFYTGATVYNITCILADGLLVSFYSTQLSILAPFLCVDIISRWQVWRTFVIFSGSSLRPFVSLLFLIYLGTFCESNIQPFNSLHPLSRRCRWFLAMSVVQIVEVHKPNGLNASFKFSLPFFVLSLSENVILSGCIVLRLLVMRRREGVGAHRSKYTSVAAMITESAVLYSVFNLCFIVPYIVGHPIGGIFLDMLGQIQVCLSLL